MIRLTRVVRRWFADGSVIYECRNCGTTLGPDAESCPNCDCETISRYDLSERNR